MLVVQLLLVDSNMFGLVIVIDHARPGFAIG